MPGGQHIDVITPVLDEAEMSRFAASLAERIRVPLVCYLEGDLGAGKTTFVRAMLRALGYTGRVKSPTYGLLEHYLLDTLEVLHLDLYRIENPEELEFLGMQDLIGDRTALLVEWPDRGAGHLPEADFAIQFEHRGPKRRLLCAARSETGAILLDAVQEFIDSFSS